MSKDYRRNCLDTEEEGRKDLSFGVFHEFYPDSDQIKREVWYWNGIKVHFEHCFDEDGSIGEGTQFHDLWWEISGIPEQPLNEPENYAGINAHWHCWQVDDGKLVLGTGLGYLRSV